MGCAVSRLCLAQPPKLLVVEEPVLQKPSIKLCAPENVCKTFADVGDKVVVYVDFGLSWRPCSLRVANHHGIRKMAASAACFDDDEEQRPDRYRYEIMVAGQITELELVHPADQSSSSFKAWLRLPDDDYGGYTEGLCIPIRLPYTDQDGKTYKEVSEFDVEQASAVLFQPLWSQLKKHNRDSIVYETMCRSGSILKGVGYGSMDPRQGIPQGGVDEEDAQHIESVDAEAARDEERRRLLAPVSPAKRFWPDSWEMKCWRSHCDCILRSDRPLPRFIATFFVAPLTNVTGLSLHYQLYLVEIFHTRFWTKLGHYLFMPLVVLAMLTFFAQFRFQGCYTTDNISVLVPNGAAVLAAIFLVWYIIWGLIQKTPFMGIFMVLPLFVLYCLANVCFQLAVKNTRQILGISFPPEACWNNTKLYRDFYFYNGFTLIAWYFNPVTWALVMAFGQTMSHLFEPKIPPRVSQTAHWMSIPDMLKAYGIKTFWILFCQAIFGTVDEFLASPRILPLLILRVCYTLGYQPKEWRCFTKLVKKCQEYGDPALDYIGTGGSQWVPEGSSITDDRTRIGQLKKEVKSMKHALSDSQEKMLSDPRHLKRFKEEGKVDAFLEHYIVLRHYVAQYELQVYAYGPFRTEHEDHHAMADNNRMQNDFGHNSSFINFLQQVRFGLWSMEDQLITRRATCWSNCCSVEP